MRYLSVGTSYPAHDSSKKFEYAIKCVDNIITHGDYCRRYKHWLSTEYVTDWREGREPTLPQWFWPPHLSPLAGSLLVGLLHWDPAMRLTAESVMQHPWCLGIAYDEYKQLLLQQMLHDELLLDGGEPVEVKKDLFAAGPSSRRESSEFDLSSSLTQPLTDRLQGLAISSGISSSNDNSSSHVNTIVPATNRLILSSKPCLILKSVI